AAPSGPRPPRTCVRRLRGQAGPPGARRGEGLARRARRDSPVARHPQRLAMTALLTVVGWTLMHVGWQACAIALATAVALRACAHRSANTRYLVACAGLFAMLVAPLVTARVLSTSIDDGHPAADSQLLAIDHARPILSHVADRDAHPTSDPPARTPPDVRLPTLDSIAPAITIAWLAGVLLLLTRMAGGWWRVRRLHRSAFATDASHWQFVCRRLAFRLGL